MMRPGHWMVLLILVAIPFATGLPHGFVYDDHGSIAENPFLDEPGNFRKLLTFQTLTDSAIPDGRRPLVVLSYLFDRVVWGSKPFGYHLTNLFLHSIVVVLVVVLVRRTQPEREPFLAFAAALLYGVHPVLTETVQCPAFREDILLTLFVLLFLLTTMRQRTVWLSIPALALALLAKESAVVAPALLLWMWICFPAGRLRRGTAAVLFGVCAALIVLFAMLWFKSGSFQAATTERAPMALQFPANLLTAPWLWVKGPSRSGVATTVDCGLCDHAGFADFGLEISGRRGHLARMRVCRSHTGPPRAVDCFRHGMDADRLRTCFQHRSSL